MAPTFYRRGSRRALRFLTAAAVSAAALLAAPALAGGSARVVHTMKVFLGYSGQEEGSVSAIGKVTSFTPPVVYQKLDWLVGWSFWCTATLTYSGSPKGLELGCNAEGIVYGNYESRTVAGPPSGECYSHYEKARGATWRLAGLVTNSYGDQLRVSASMPANGAAVWSSQPCGYPPGNLRCNRNIDTVATTPSLLTHFNVEIPVSASCVLTGWSGKVSFNSSFGAMYIYPEPAPPPSTPPSLPHEWAGQMFTWITDRIHDYLIGPTVPPTPAPYLDSQFTGWLHGTVTDLDPHLLFSVNQALRGHTPTRLTVLLASAQVRRMALLSAPPRLHFDLTFAPAKGAPARYVGTMMPTLPAAALSVTFSGSVSDPTITVNGRDLNPLPKPQPAVLQDHYGCPTAAGTYGTDYGTSLALTDVTGNWGAGRYDPGTEIDCIGLLPTGSPSAVTIKLGSIYGDNPGSYSLANGDLVQVVVNGAAIEVHVDYGATVTS